MKYISIIFFLITFFSCKNEENLNISKLNNIDYRFKIETSRDTFHINEFVKAIASLETPFFVKENSKIIVIIESDENTPLKNDLSNEYEISIEAFHNLSVDSINQKWFEGYDFNKSSAFGKKFNSPGVKKIRGYVMEYITDEPQLDSIYDKNKVMKYYFEKDVIIID